MTQSSAVPGSMRPAVHAEQQDDDAGDREPRALEHRGVPEDREPQRHDERVVGRRRQVDAVAVAVTVAVAPSPGRRRAPPEPSSARASRPRRSCRRPSRRPGAAPGGPRRPRCTCGARSRRGPRPAGSRRSCTRGPASGSTTRACARPTGRAGASRPAACGDEHVDEEDEHRERDDERADGDRGGSGCPSPCPRRTCTSGGADPRGRGCASGRT